MAVGEPVAEEAPDELLSFAARADGNGLEIVDRVERRHFTVETPVAVSPRPVPTDTFEFPVDEAVAIETDGLHIPQPTGVLVRNSLGFVVAELTKGEATSLPVDRYSCDVPAPIKLYVEFEGACTIDTAAEDVRMEFDRPTTVNVGARSRHKQPAASLTTTADPEDLMTAVSYFGSALKTTTCERSYPTLRGHPPTVQLGDELRVPGVLTAPDTGVRLELPPDCGSVFVGASLAYYLGAAVVPGDAPRLVTESGFVQPLGGGARDFEEAVERTLKQVFLLDCLTRTEGYFQVDLHERNELEAVLDLDFAELYDRPLGEQLEAYLDVPYRRIEHHVPQWKLTAHVTPEPQSVELLPFVVNDLATIRTPSAALIDRSESAMATIEDFVRTGRVAADGAARSTVESAPTPALVRVDESDSLEQTWVGDGAPLGASKAMIEAYRNRLGRRSADDDIDITVVCNAEEMGGEQDIVNEVYGSREELPFDIERHTRLTTDELRTVLQAESDFLHYIGHIDAGGFECADGRLDAATLDHTGVDVFFLNACTSYDQGMRLIEAGSIAGIVTLQDVINSGAERVGMTLARLLNSGFPLGSALNLAKTQSIMGGHYLVIGDGTADVVQPEGLFPALCRLKQRRDGWSLRYESYPTRGKGIGSLIFPYIGENEQYFLTSGETKVFEISDDELREFFSLGEMTLEYDGEISWSSGFDDV